MKRIMKCTNANEFIRPSRKSWVSLSPRGDRLQGSPNSRGPRGLSLLYKCRALKANSSTMRHGVSAASSDGGRHANTRRPNVNIPANRVAASHRTQEVGTLNRLVTSWRAISSTEVCIVTDKNKGGRKNNCAECGFKSPPPHVWTAELVD